MKNHFPFIFIPVTDWGLGHLALSRTEINIIQTHEGLTD